MHDPVRLQLMHVNRALLYALLVFLAARLLSRLSSTPLAWGIAAVLFAVDDAHAYSSGWISGANTLLACAFGIWALLMPHHWRRDRSRTHFLLAQIAFFLSLLTATIEETTQDGRPNRVRFAFKTDLSRFAWLRSGLDGPRPIELPAPGHALTIDPWSSR